MHLYINPVKELSKMLLKNLVTSKGRSTSYIGRNLWCIREPIVYKVVLSQDIYGALNPSLVYYSGQEVVL